MKLTIIHKSILAALLLSGSLSALQAQDAATPTCPFGHEPGYGRSLTPEQRAVHRTVVQQLITELKAKRDNGTVAPEELAWLQAVEKRGGMCINGEPRGPRAGKGPANGRGNGQGRGLRDGTGPRGANGTCPQGNAPGRAGR